MTAPQPPADPGWRVEVDGDDPRLARVHESVLALGDGRLGTRGSPLYGDGAADPDVFHAGVYVGTGPATELARLPSWARLGGPDRPARRVLDLRHGMLYENGSVRFSSLARPGTVVLRVPGGGGDARRTVPGPVTAPAVRSGTGSARTTRIRPGRPPRRPAPRAPGSTGWWTSTAGRGRAGGPGPISASTATRGCNRHCGSRSST